MAAIDDETPRDGASAARVDPRIVRTRASLQDALMVLALERSLDEISVSDIVEKAGVNRSSFYQHYADKETLLSDALGRGLADVAERAACRSRGEIFDGEGVPVELTDYLEHIAANAPLYRRVLGEHATPAAVASLRQGIVGVILQALEPAMPTAFPGVPGDVVAAGIAGSALAVVGEWLRRQPLAPVPVAAHWVWSVLLGLGGVADGLGDTC